MSFVDRLAEAVARLRSPLVLGIDPHLELLPEEFAGARDPHLPRAERAERLLDFALELVDLARERVPAVKPQAAFFELFGADGARAWERLVVQARAAGLLVIGDVKRGDIASTAAAYASAYLEGPQGGPPEARCDAITVNPFLGEDAVRPFLDVCRRTGGGIFVLLRTSNSGSADLQLHGEPPLYLRLAERVAAWGEELVGECGLSAVGAVVGATQPAALRELRAALPRTPFLLPGVGAQGAGVADVSAGFLAGGRGALVAASRSVAFAHRDPGRAGRPWKDAARDALDELVGELRETLGV